MSDTALQGSAVADGTDEMTERFILAQCRKHDGYSTPELNEKLYLHHFGFSRLGGLASFTGCTVLYLSHNALTSLCELAPLVHLDSLYLASNALASLETLPLLPALHLLDVASNQLASLSALDTAAPQLQTLLASRNHLSQLAGLQGCTNLLSLDVSHNRLADEEKVESALRPLRAGLRTLMLHGNDLCRSTSHYRKRYIATFTALRFLDEYPVFDDERERAEAFMRGGAAAEAEARLTQKARAAAAEEEQFLYYGDFRQQSRAARPQDGVVRPPTAYFLAHTSDTAPVEDRPESDDDAVFVPATAGVHADPRNACPS